ncbi:unannotated protein [freshwater metagenome]|uniref:Unannotated protein n=1 Tax=freshwater metagenome TaxID=449393 RepID=A0A6J7N7Q9_9ZZZZ
MREPGLEALAVLGSGRHASAAGGRDGQGDGDRAPEHVLHLGRLVEDLVHGDADEIHEHQVAHRSKAPGSSTDAEADDRLLGDRGVLDPLVAIGGEEAIEHVEDAAVAGDILADEEDVGVLGHDLVHALVEGLDIGEFARVHGDSFWLRRCRRRRGCRPGPDPDCSGRTRWRRLSPPGSATGWPRSRPASRGRARCRSPRAA